MAQALPGAPEHYLAQYSSARHALPGAALPWVDAYRETAASRLGALGFPSSRSEQWKYTSVVPLQRIAFEAAYAGVAPTRQPETLCADGACHRIQLVDGCLRPEASRLGGMPPGVSVRSFAEALEQDSEILRNAMGRPQGSPFALLNTALAHGGVVIQVDSGVNIVDPIEIVYASASGAAPTATHSRTVLSAGAGSEATVVEHHVRRSGDRFANHVFDASVGEAAVLRHIRVQDEGDTAFHINTGFVRVATGGRFESVTVTTGGRLVRNDTVVELQGPEAECAILGAYVGRGGEHVDNTLRVVHQSPRTRSRELYKGVLDGGARGVFQGTVVVERDAQKTEAHQLHRAILLSGGAEVDVKPELRIYADDVRCGHGATSGQVDDDQVFYLESRGIPENAARQLLVEAFLAEVVSEVANSGIRASLETMLHERMPC